MRDAVAELVIAATVLALGGALALIACLTLVGALALALWPFLAPPVTLGIVGALLALLGCIAAATGWRMASSRR